VEVGESLSQLVS